MALLEKVIAFLQFEMETPAVYGWFHILSIAVMIGLTVLLCWKKANVKKTLLISSVVMLILEVYKQLSFSYSGGQWRYQWYAFPFQFCSVPMYVALVAGLTNNRKLESYIMSFLATYGLVAGIAVMAYPVTVFVPEVLINVQTMVHHGLMVVVGVFLLIRGHVQIHVRTLCKGLCVFTVLVAIALTANVVTYYCKLDGGLELFYISPFHTPELPVYDQIFGMVPYPVFLFLYIFGFTLGGGIVLGVAHLIKNLKAGGNKHGKIEH